MNKFLSIATAVAAALTISMSVSTQSRADEVGAGIVGGVLGFMAGAAVGSDIHHHHHYEYDDETYADHVAACRDAYHWRYSIRTDTYLDSDGDRYPCEL